MQKTLADYEKQVYELFDSLNTTNSLFKIAEQWYEESNRLGKLVMPKIADIEQVALRELKLQDTIDDINNEEVSRKDLWRSAFICGGIAIRDKIKSNFSA